MSIINYIIGAVGAGILLLGALFGLHPQQQLFGATNPSATPLFDTVLTQQMGTSDTVMYLKSVTDNQGNVLSGFQCFTVDVNSPTVEYLCGTISGTTVTGLTRNLSYVTGTTTYATPTNIHRVGADVRITDFPGLTVLTNQALGKETFQNPLEYANHPCSVSAASGTICDKYYIDNTTIAGASAGSPTVAGIFLGSTALQAASSTATGVYNAVTYNRVLQAGNATDTPQSGCAVGYTSTAGAGCGVFATLKGTIAQAWLDLTAAYTWTGTHIFNGAVTIAASVAHNLTLNTVAYVFPSSQGAASTFLQNNGSGTLSWVSGGWTQIVSTTTTQGMSYATTTLGSYTDILITIAMPKANNQDLCIRFNGDASSKYNGEVSELNGFKNNPQGVDTVMRLTTGGAATTTNAYFTIEVPGLAATTTKQFLTRGTMVDQASDYPITFMGSGVYQGTSTAPLGNMEIDAGDSRCGLTSVPANTRITVYGQ